jgi:hypothetical protein
LGIEKEETKKSPTMATELDSVRGKRIGVVTVAPTITVTHPYSKHLFSSLKTSIPKLMI